MVENYVFIMPVYIDKSLYTCPPAYLPTYLPTYIHATEVVAIVIYITVLCMTTSYL